MSAVKAYLTGVNVGFNIRMGGRFREDYEVIIESRFSPFCMHVVYQAFSLFKDGGE